MELYWDSWALRLGRFMEPTVANGRSLYYNLFVRHGDQLEVEHDHELGDKPGAVRLLIYRNLANAGRYLEAVAAAPAGTIPDITSVRGLNPKVGFGLSVEQTLSPSVAVWVRGLDVVNPVEQYAFTEIDNCVSAGLSIRGWPWHRPDDTFAAGFSSNGLNGSHRDYLAAGGLGGFLGDGRLHYGREAVAEVYYSLLALRGVHLTLDYQRIANPGHNFDRHGPVNILSGRVHAEF
jgi:carbohydrate-selective porin OprB